MISELVEQATALIWLCVEDEDCVSHIRQREAKRDEHDELLIALLEWAGSYRTREESSGFAAHQHLFEGFSGSKLQLMNRDEVTAFVSTMQQID
jgi:hypothetical protein